MPSQLVISTLPSLTRVALYPSPEGQGFTATFIKIEQKEQPDYSSVLANLKPKAACEEERVGD